MDATSLPGGSGTGCHEAGRVQEMSADLVLTAGRKRTLPMESTDSKKHRTGLESEAPTPIEEMMSTQPMNRFVNLSRDILLNKMLSGAAYGNESNIYNPLPINDFEVCTPQCLLLALIHSLAKRDLMSSILLAEICHRVQQLRSRNLRVWLLEDFEFQRADIETAMSLLCQLVADGTLKLPPHVMTIMISLAKKYRITTEQLKTLSEEGCRDFAIQLENAVANNCPRDIFELEGEGADIHGLTQSGDSLLHLAARTGSSASIAALSILNADLEVVNSSNATPLEEAVRCNSPSSVKALLKAGAKFDKHFFAGDTYIHIAATGGHNEALQALIEGEMDINEKNHLGETPLVQAIRSDNVRGIELLLKKGADFSDILGVKLKDGDSIVHSMSRSGNIDVLKLLRDRGITANIKNEKGLTPLHVACNTLVMRLLLRMGAEVNAVDDKGDTPLMVAVRNNQADIINLLLLNKADPNVNNRGQTALHYAVEGGSAEAVSTLLDAGAIVYNVGSPMIDTPVYIATVKNKSEILQLLLEKSDLAQRDQNGFVILHYEAQKGHVEVVKALLDAGAAVDMKGQYMQTALHRAAGAGHTAVVEALLDAGAELNIKDSNQKTALHHAAERGHTAVVEVLLDAGAELNIKDSNQKTALHHAAELGHTAVVKSLLDAGAAVDMKSEYGRTALHRAAAAGHTAVVKALLDAGAIVTMKDNEQNTALHLSTNTSVVTMLLDAGAVINMKGNCEKTALYNAAKSRNIGMVKLLLDRGADPSAKLEDGTSALMFLSRYGGSLDIVKLLVEHGANVNDKDNKGWDAFRYANNYKEKEIIAYLSNKR